MNIFRRAAPAAALLAMMIIVPAPAAQSMTPKNDSVSSMSVVTAQKTVLQLNIPNKKVIASQGHLSTNTNPRMIKKLVRRAWYNKEFRWHSTTQWNCFNQLIMHESSWDPWATNGRGWEETGGIPQAHPSYKMASEGKDYVRNVWTQVKWGLRYIYSVYKSPCHAWSRWQDRAGSGSYGWY